MRPGRRLAFYFKGHGHRLCPPRPAQRGEGRGEGSAKSSVALFKRLGASPCTSASQSLVRQSHARRLCDGHLPRCLEPGSRYRFEDWAFAVLDDDLNWFQEHLPVPNDLRGGRALCWFRPEAREVIARAWQLAKLVESAGIPVRVYRKVRPGTVVYEDDFQIAAVPWRGTFRA